jgi:hypothetical protein
MSCCNGKIIVEIDREWNYHPHWGMKYTIHFGCFNCGAVFTEKGGNFNDVNGIN